MAKLIENEFYIWKRFNKLIVLSFSHKIKDRRYFLCKCDCGKEKKIAIQSIVRWSAKSCWCWYKLNINDFIWRKFWDLSPIKFYEQEDRKPNTCDCLCVCWKTIYWVTLNRLKSHLSCWCKLDQNWNRNPCFKHGMASMQPNWDRKHRFYRIYQWLHNRCTCATSRYYKNYWWRWICCLRKNFEEFYNDMFENYNNHVKEYWEKDTTIDRINNDWHYCKENCRWATVAENNKNKRNIKYLWDENINEFCHRMWFCYRTVLSYFDDGKDIEYIIKKLNKENTCNSK
jgi:hypothetical protein